MGPSHHKHSSLVTHSILIPHKQTHQYILNSARTIIVKMSFAPGLLPRLFPASAKPQHLLKPFRSIHTPSAAQAFRASRQAAPARAISIPRTLPRSKTLFYTAGLGLSFLTFNAFSPSRSVQCQSAFGSAGPSPAGRADAIPDSPKSILNVSELGFGAVAGICAGVFLKKGLKALAFLLGGAFVFLQASLRCL